MLNMKIMKNYIILFALFININCKAQIREPNRILSRSQTQISYDFQNGDYIMDTTNNLNIYEGTWLYNDNHGTIFTLRLQRKNRLLNDLPGGTYGFDDNIIATYKLEKNGVVLFDNLSAILPVRVLATFEDGYFGYFCNYTTFNDLDGTFHDVPYQIISDCTIKKLPVIAGQSEKISFKLYGAFRLNPHSFYEALPAPFSIPNNIVLTKQP